MKSLTAFISLIVGLLMLSCASSAPVQRVITPEEQRWKDLWTPVDKIYGEILAEQMGAGSFNSSNSINSVRNFTSHMETVIKNSGDIELQRTATEAKLNTFYPGYLGFAVTLNRYKMIYQCQTIKDFIEQNDSLMPEYLYENSGADFKNSTEFLYSLIPDRRKARVEELHNKTLVDMATVAVGIAEVGDLLRQYIYEGKR